MNSTNSQRGANMDHGHGYEKWTGQSLEVKWEDCVERNKRNGKC